MHRFNPACIIAIAVLVGYTLLAPAIEAQQRSGIIAEISGVVVEDSGRPVAYAYLFVAGRSTAITTGDGKFQLSGLDSNSSVVIGLRRIGYIPLDTTISIASERSVVVRLQMRRLVSQLDTVLVKATRSEYDDYLDRAGFYQRMSKRIDGTFLSHRDIEKRNSLTLTSVLRDVNGVKVVSRSGKGGRNGYVVGRGGLCALGLVLDGQRVEINNPPIEAIQPRITSIIGSRPVSAVETKRAGFGAESLDQLVNLSAVSAVEVYPSASSVPNGLQHHAQGCGLIVVWTSFH